MWVLRMLCTREKGEVTNLFRHLFPLKHASRLQLILSRHPITAVANTQLTQVVTGGEIRGLLIATVELSGTAQSITFANTHLDHRSQEERVHSAAQLKVRGK